MNLILFFWKIIGHWDQRFEAHNSNGILLILRKLSEDWENLLQNVLFLELGSKLSKFRSASSSNHRSIFITEFNKLLSELFFRISWFTIAWEEKMAWTYSSSEPFTLSQFNHKRNEYILNLSITQVLRNSSKWISSLFSYNSLILLSKHLKTR